MGPFREFEGMDPSFWAFIKFISETLGYTDRRLGIVKTYSPEEILYVCQETNTAADEDLIYAAVDYVAMRADLLNLFVERMLMDAETASREFLRWEHLHSLYNFKCKLPLNKQKGAMKQVAYFTAIINILTEKTIRELTDDPSSLGFDDDPRGLTFIRDDEGFIVGASSRRFDGAYPSIQNPKLIWEIKEYYYATTFGSRVADGVYETQLDGFEFREICDRTGIKIYHVLFIDAYRTWWTQGKSYLCRLIDALNSGVVDEVIVGREVFTRWPELLRTVILDDVVQQF